MSEKTTHDAELEGGVPRRPYEAPRIVTDDVVFERPAQTGPVCNPDEDPDCVL